MESGVIYDTSVEKSGDVDHSTAYCPQNARLNTARLYGWMPYINSLDSNPNQKITIKIELHDLFTIEAVDIQQGDQDGSGELFNKITFASESYWNQGTYIHYNLDELVTSGNNFEVRNLNVDPF